MARNGCFKPLSLNARPEPILANPARVWGIIDRHCGVEMWELIGKGRTARVSDARCIAVHLLLACGLSLEKIGLMLGGRDHSTIIYLRRKAEARMGRSGQYLLTLARMRMELQEGGK